MKPSRTVWCAGFPPVRILAPESSVKQHPAYSAAKTGNVQAATRLVGELVSDEEVDALRGLLGNLKPIVASAMYLMVDDFVGQGGTLANFRGHIESRGGAVIGAVTLTGKPHSATLALSEQLLATLRKTHGELENWWLGRFGFGFEALTESEARYLVRTPHADTIRSRLAETE